MLEPKIALPVQIRGPVDVERLPKYPEPIQIAPDRNLVLKGIQPLGKDDVTVLVEHGAFLEALKDADATPRNYRERKSMDFSAKVEIQSGDAPITSKKPCRIHAVSAFGGGSYSVTIRDWGLKTPEWKPPAWNAEWKTWRNMLGWPGDFGPRKDDLKYGYLETQWRIAEAMHHGVFGEDGSVPPAKGLVLVTGATASGKTRLMNIMIGKYLCGLFRTTIPERRPHIVALGDPVETLFLQKAKDSGLPQIAECQNADGPLHSRAFDFTARVLGVDANSVDSALKDALRETPAAFIVSELRDKEDFRATLEFAATGHLVFATAHSTSLVDAAAKLMDVFGAVTPSTRSALAQRLKAVVHVRPLEVTYGGKTLLTTLPTIWRGNAMGVRNFVADGLSSLLPRGQSAFGNPEGPGVLGLAYTAARLGKDADETNAAYEHCEGDKEYFGQLLRLAHEKDLEIR